MAAEHRLQLAGLKGLFILSLNENLEVRRIFRRFVIEPVTVNYSVNGADQKPAAELLISSKR